ncbi:MAG: hypothetical protein AAF629_04695 [Chloroflexota bacterium]
MNTAQTASTSHLPLSWARTNTTTPEFDVVSLSTTKTAWIPTAEIPNNISFEQLYQTHLSQCPQGFVCEVVT